MRKDSSTCLVTRFTFLVITKVKKHAFTFNTLLSKTSIVVEVDMRMPTVHHTSAAMQKVLSMYMCRRDKKLVMFMHLLTLEINE